MNLLYKITTIITADRGFENNVEACSPDLGEVCTHVKIYQILHFKYVNIILFNYTSIELFK